LKGFDYSQGGYYFVTVCVQNRKEIFGKIVGARRDSPNENKIILNNNGKIIESIWKTLPKHHNVLLDEFCIMSDHVHFILIIKNNIKNITIDNMGESRLAPTKYTNTLGFIIGMFKTECTKQINILNKTPGVQLFQRNYYEHIIRNEKEYLSIKQYINDNPKNWRIDNENNECKIG